MRQFFPAATCRRILKSIFFAIPWTLVTVGSMQCGGEKPPASANSPVRCAPSHADSSETCVVRIDKFVNAPAGLRMRMKPVLQSQRILTIPHGTAVTITHRGGKEQRISGKRGRWARVKHAGKEGWVFEGFLSKKKPDTEQAKKRLHCRSRGRSWVHNKAYKVNECRAAWMNRKRVVTLNYCGGVEFTYYKSGRVNFRHSLTGFTGSVGRWKVAGERIKVELSKPKSGVAGGGHYRDKHPVHFLELRDKSIIYLNLQGQAITREPSEAQIKEAVSKGLCG